MADYYALKNLDHDPSLAQALGNMVVVWAYTDTVLFSTISRVTGIGLNMAMTGYHRIPTFEARVKFILALLSEWKTDKFDREAISTAIEKISHLAGTRNHWVHGDWCANREKTEVVIFDHRSAPDTSGRRKPVKAADIKNHYEAVQKRAAALAELIDWNALSA